jgi:hypothetical protein
MDNIMVRQERLDEIVARRSLKIPGSNRRAMVYLGKPQQIKSAGQTYYPGIADVSIPKGAWICPFKITGLPEIEDLPHPFFCEAWGHDSLDALISAVSIANAVLDKCQPPLQWTWSWGFDTGFPIMLDIYGLPNKLEMADKFAREIGRNLKRQAGRPRPQWVLKAFGRLPRKTPRGEEMK